MTARARLTMLAASTVLACMPPANTTSAPHPLSRAGVTRAIDSLVARPEFANAHWGILIVDPTRGDTLYAHNAGKLFMPASNMKIVTAAVALAQLGPDYRFRTTVATNGRIADSLLLGDLVLIGRGDPTISNHMRGDAMIPLREIADSLRAMGIARIAGQVVSAGNAFPDANYGFGWGWDDFDFPYSAGVDELLFNEGFTEVVVYGGAAPGDSVRVATRPATAERPIRILASTVAPTVSEGDLAVATTRVTVQRDTANGGSGALMVTGTILPGDSSIVRLAHRDPTASFLHALGDALHDRGIVVDARAASVWRREGTASDSSPVITLFAVESPPLREILPALQKPSQNQIAEVLLKTLGLERTGIGSADSGRAVIENQLVLWGAAPGGFVVRDGSGLSRHNYLTPTTIVQVLDAMRRNSSFTVFYEALPVAGIDGTIARRMRGTAAEGNVRAKTGYIDRARSLSGYVTTADGTMLIFSFLANNWTVPVRAIEQVQDEIAARLATLELRRR